MDVVLCGKCGKMVSTVALPVHVELNHPKRHLSNLAALERGREVLRERRIQRETERAALSKSWEGRT